MMAATTRVTDEQIAEWTALAEAAVRGPWIWEPESEHIRTTTRVLAPGQLPVVSDVVAMHLLWEHGAFIAAARTAVPALCADDLALRAALRDSNDYTRGVADGARQQKTWIVAWLREYSDRIKKITSHNRRVVEGNEVRASVFRRAADAIERTLPPMDTFDAVSDQT